MRLPLLVGACPRLVRSTPKVRLYKGTWLITASGLKDSTFIIHSNEPSHSKNVFRGPCEVQVEFVDRGTEKILSIYAVLQEETVNVA